MKKLTIFSTCVLLLACSSKPIPFTDYLVKNLLRDNLEALATPAIFDVEDIAVKTIEATETTGIATAHVRLRFPEDFDTVVSLRRLEPYSVTYLQYKSSFGKFAAGESQVHYAEYKFERRDGKWFIAGSRAMSPPEVFPAAGSAATQE
ncbi:hypothetical protein [Zhongshania arctica]|uniref:Lipoprotein n=1 Tax=Zhongshania arctica TaxID=3238302 RepID=A0ABV3TU99_9GAMM|tara:strand:+ start:419 stop:862 length:444 start_codon:yes stop_codon:yes gene_type:complete